MHVFLISALVGGDWSASRPCRFTPERAPGTHCTGGRMDPRGCLDDVEKIKFLTLPGLELWPLGRPARSQSLYPLRYPGSTVPKLYVKNSKFWKENVARCSSFGDEHCRKILKYNRSIFLWYLHWQFWPVLIEETIKMKVQSVTSFKP
jgi:hypothetical protein